MFSFTFISMGPRLVWAPAALAAITHPFSFAVSNQCVSNVAHMPKPAAGMRWTNNNLQCTSSHAKSSDYVELKDITVHSLCVRQCNFPLITARHRSERSRIMVHMRDVTSYLHENIQMDRNGQRRLFSCLSVVVFFCLKRHILAISWQRLNMNKYECARLHKRVVSRFCGTHSIWSNELITKRTNETNKLRL